MKNKILSVILACLTVFLFVGCNGESQQQEVKVYTLLPTEKYMREQEIDFAESNELSFVGIKAETQSAQIMFNSDKKINSFDLRVQDLFGKNNQIIKAENVSVFAERYVEIYLPFMQNQTYLSMSGYYPDALVPLDKYKMRLEDKVSANDNQTLWIDVNIPTDAVEGEYTGKFTLVVNDIEKDIDVKLYVYDLVMPEEVHSASHFAIWYEQIAFGEGDNMDSQTYQRYYDYLLTKRLCSAQLTPAETKNMTTYLTAIEKAATNPKVTSYIIPLTSSFGTAVDDSIKLKLCPEKSESNYTEEDKKIIDKTYTTLFTGIKNQLKTILDRNIELRQVEGKENIDLFAKAFYYCEDEPPIGSSRMRFVRIFNEIMTKAKNEILNEYSSVFENNSDLLSSFKSLYAICPSIYMQDALFVSNNDDGTPNYEKGDGLMFWCPEMYMFNDKSFRDTALERLEYGENLWWYLCVSNTPRPSYYVESLPVNIRMQSWMQYNYSVQGVLYWDVCHFGGPYKETGSSVYDDVYYGGYGGGEGILLYPGERYGMKNPLSSWRLEQIRLGQQDYELFYMLNSYLELIETEITAVDVVDNLGKNMYTGTTVDLKNGTPEALENARLAILEILEKFQDGDINSAISLVEKIVK